MPAIVQGKIMVVDDNPANLKLLEDMLRQEGYDIRSFPLGRLALAAAEQEPPDLILLDVNMPEINGYQVCEQLKSKASLRDIPVIFLSALNAVEDKVKGFRSGGVDYISKPFQFEEVQARVETHLRLRRAQQAEHDLLERTLGGAVATLWELVQLTSPVLALRSKAIREIVVCITKDIGIADPWQYELAATLCLMGCVALPEDVFEKAYCGHPLSPDEEQMFRAHPESAARLISHIPRLEVVAEMIRGQQLGDAEPLSEPARQGTRMLRVALELDRRIYRGVHPRAALDQLRMSRRFDVPMLEALDGYSPLGVEFEVVCLPIRDLHAGMVLEEDVLSPVGKMPILKQGTVLTQTWIERLGNFARSQGLQDLVRVGVPKFGGVGKPSKPGGGAAR
jgi:CheY-like chemotaxis protein